MLLSIFAAAVMAFNLNTADVKFYHNTKEGSDRVFTTTVYEKTGSFLKNKSKIQCTFDEANRLISKETLRWDALNEEWGNCYRYEFTYSDTGYTVVYAIWDKKAQRYVPTKKMECQDVMGDAHTVTTYKWNNESKNYEALGDPMLMYQDYSLYVEVK